MKKITLLLSMIAAVPAVLFAAQAAEFDTLLISGRYSAAVFPSLDPKSAQKVESEVKRVNGVDEVSVSPAGNSLQFSVKSKTQLDASQIDQAVKRAAPWASMLEPEPAAPEAPARQVPGNPQGF